MNVANLNISIEADLLRQLDTLVDRRIFATRSQAIQAALKEKVTKVGGPKRRGRNATEKHGELSKRRWPEF